MSVYLRSIGPALLLLLSVPVRADAGLATFLDYLDNLSGPGPFVGGGYEMAVFCMDDSSKPPKLTWRCYGSSTDFGPSVEFGPHISWLKGQTNDDLIYPEGVSDNEKAVNVLGYGGQATAILTRNLGATVRFTRYRFSGPRVRDGSQSRSVVGIGPVLRAPLKNRYRLEVTPLLLLGLDEFANEDFGLIGAPLGSDNLKGALHIGIYF